MALLVLVATLAGCKTSHQNLPPAQMMMEPGPGVGGPGPGVMMYRPNAPMGGHSSQVAFVGPDGMNVRWDISVPGQFDSEPMVCPGRTNFPQGGIYRLKLSEIPGRAGAELYPTLEVGAAMPRTAAFLSHNAVPVQFTEEDFDQVLSGNFVTKVIYLPDPEFQELALAGVETLVSTRLDPGVDPISEADHRGSILAIVRLGNKDLGIPGEQLEAEGVVPAMYGAPAMAGGGYPAGGGGTIPMNYISGVTGPQYWLPISGTPIGLPGPPHVPLGIPAGLQKHVIKNHTCVHMPKPTRRVKIDVRQDPGYRYPKPANHAFIVEQPLSPIRMRHQPLCDTQQVIAPGVESTECQN